MARTSRAIEHNEQAYMCRLKRQGWTDRQIAVHFGRDLKRTQAAIETYSSPYRPVLKEECNPKFSSKNDSGPKLRCRCCGNLVTRVCKSDSRKCVVCDMRQQSQSATKRNGSPERVRITTALTAVPRIRLTIQKEAVGDFGQLRCYPCRKIILDYFLVPYCKTKKATI